MTCAPGCDSCTTTRSSKICDRGYPVNSCVYDDNCVSFADPASVLQDYDRYQSPKTFWEYSYGNNDIVECGDIEVTLNEVGDVDVEIAYYEYDEKNIGGQKILEEGKIYHVMTGGYTRVNMDGYTFNVSRSELIKNGNVIITRPNMTLESLNKYGLWDDKLIYVPVKEDEVVNLNNNILVLNDRDAYLYHDGVISFTGTAYVKMINTMIDVAPVDRETQPNEFTVSTTWSDYTFTQPMSTIAHVDDHEYTVNSSFVRGPTQIVSQTAGELMKSFGNVATIDACRYKCAIDHECGEFVKRGPTCYASDVISKPPDMSFDVYASLLADLNDNTAGYDMEYTDLDVVLTTNLNRNISKEKLYEYPIKNDLDVCAELCENDDGCRFFSMERYIEGTTREEEFLGWCYKNSNDCPTCINVHTQTMYKDVAAAFPDLTPVDIRRILRSDEHEKRMEVCERNCDIIKDNGDFTMTGNDCTTLCGGILATTDNNIDDIDNDWNTLPKWSSYKSYHKRFYQMIKQLESFTVDATGMYDWLTELDTDLQGQTISGITFTQDYDYETSQFDYAQYKAEKNLPDMTTDGINRTVYDRFELIPRYHTDNELVLINPSVFGPLTFGAVTADECVQLCLDHETCENIFYTAGECLSVPPMPGALRVDNVDATVTLDDCVRACYTDSNCESPYLNGTGCYGDTTASGLDMTYSAPPCGYGSMYKTLSPDIIAKIKEGAEESEYNDIPYANNPGICNPNFVDTLEEYVECLDKQLRYETYLAAIRNTILIEDVIQLTTLRTKIRENRYQDNDIPAQCMPVSPGYVMADPYTQAPCPAGRYSLNGMRCEDCPVGKFKADGDLHCSVCQSGQGPTSDRTACMDCGGASKYSNHLGECANCPTGYSANADGYRCIRDRDVTPPGQFRLQDGYFVFDASLAESQRSTVRVIAMAIFYEMSNLDALIQEY